MCFNPSIRLVKGSHTKNGDKNKIGTNGDAPWGTKGVNRDNHWRHNLKVITSESQWWQ
jgi:hypothetical protein